MPAGAFKIIMNLCGLSRRGWRSSYSLFFSPFEVVIGEGTATVLDNSWLAYLVDSQVSQARFHVSAGCQLISPEEVLISLVVARLSPPE